MPGVAETFKHAIDKITHETKSKLVNSLHTESPNVAHEPMNTSIDNLENQ
jgi:hypothetical protein